MTGVAELASYHIYGCVEKKYIRTYDNAGGYIEYKWKTDEQFKEIVYEMIKVYQAKSVQGVK
jgi:hypothetical protein